MLILLPPSESKATRTRGAPLDLERLSFPSLTAERQSVAAALQRASAAPYWPERLGVSPNLRAEVERNLALPTAPTLPAAACYTGVLYDALGLDTLDAAARRRASRWVVVVSALYGAVRLTDRIAPYRLAMGVNLPGVGPLAAHWRPALDGVLTEAAGTGLVVDCRSSDYAAAWTPPPHLAPRWVHIRVPGASHMAKHTRGLLVRHLVTEGVTGSSVAALAKVAGTAFDVALTPSSSPRRPHLLDVSVRA